MKSSTGSQNDYFDLPTFNVNDYSAKWVWLPLNSKMIPRSQKYGVKRRPCILTVRARCWQFNNRRKVYLETMRAVPQRALKNVGKFQSEPEENAKLTIAAMGRLQHLVTEVCGT